MIENHSLMIDFRHLETFCRVAARKSFSKAAEDLLITQPTVSGHILSLEKSLSLRLFDRTGREIHLTKAGQIFLRFALKILADRKELVNALSEFSQGLRGDLLLGASTIPGEYLLPRLMGDFKKQYPRLTVSLKISDTKEIVQALLQGEIEFGLIGAKIKHPSLHYEKFEEDEVIIIAPSDHPLARQKAVTVQDLLKEPWIVREEGSGTQMAVERALIRKGKRLGDFNVVIEMGSTAAVKEAVKAKLGCAFVSKIAVQEELAQNRFVRITAVGLESISRQIYMVFPKGRTVSPIGMEFLRFLKRERERSNGRGNS